MKVVIVFLLVVSLLFNITACTSGQDASVETTPQTETITNNQDRSEADPNNSIDTQSEIDSEKTVFEQYEMALKNAGISFETVRMAAEYIGAEEGYKYKIGDGKVELYLFDPNSEAYKRAELNQMVTLDGFGDFPAIVENGMCLLVSDLDEEQYIGYFKSLIK